MADVQMRMVRALRLESSLRGRIESDKVNLLGAEKLSRGDASIIIVEETPSSKEERSAKLKLLGTLLIEELNLSMEKDRESLRATMIEIEGEKQGILDTSPSEKEGWDLVGEVFIFKAELDELCAMMVT